LRSFAPAQAESPPTCPPCDQARRPPDGSRALVLRDDRRCSAIWARRGHRRGADHRGRNGNGARRLLLRAILRIRRPDEARYSWGGRVHERSGDRNRPTGMSVRRTRNGGASRELTAVAENLAIAPRASREREGVCSSRGRRCCASGPRRLGITEDDPASTCQGGQRGVSVSHAPPAVTDRPSCGVLPQTSL